MKNFPEKSHSAGGLVFNTRISKFLVVCQRGVSWSLPKGHIEENETPLLAAKREIAEETGVNRLRLIANLGKVTRPNSHDPREIKEINFFLFVTSQEKIETRDSHTSEARWVSGSEMLRLLTHPKDRAFVRCVLEKFPLHQITKRMKQRYKPFVFEPFKSRAMNRGIKK